MTKTQSDSADSSIRVDTTEEGPVVRRLAVAVEAKRVRKAFDRAYRDLARSVQVKGFRPGKAPRSVLERMYGPSIAEQLEQTLIGDTLADAVELSGLEPVSEPAIESEPPTLDGSFHYTARIEVRPTVELPDLSGLPAIRPAVHVEPAEVDERLEQLRTSNAPVLEEPDGTVVADGHIVTMDYVGRIDGEPFEGGSAQGSTIEIGAGRYLPGFDEQLLGARSGDDRDVQVSFPEDYGQPDVAGKVAQFAVHVVDIRRRHVPPLDDEFAKDLGDFETLEDLRTRIEKDLADAQERESKQTLRTSLMDALLERTEFEVPPGMVERQLQSQLSSAHRRLEGQVDHDAIHAQLDRWREEWRPQAERDVREMILLQAIAESEQITVDDAAIDARFAELLGDGGDDPAKLLELRNDEQLTEALRLQLRDEKVLDFLGSQAKVEDNSGT